MHTSCRITLRKGCSSSSFLIAQHLAALRARKYSESACPLKAKPRMVCCLAVETRSGRTADGRAQCSHTVGGTEAPPALLLCRASPRIEGERPPSEQTTDESSPLSIRNFLLFPDFVSISFCYATTGWSFCCLCGQQPPARVITATTELWRWPSRTRMTTWVKGEGET